MHKDTSTQNLYLRIGNNYDARQSIHTYQEKTMILNPKHQMLQENPYTHIKSNKHGEIYSCSNENLLT